MVRLFLGSDGRRRRLPALRPDRRRPPHQLTCHDHTTSSARTASPAGRRDSAAFRCTSRDAKRCAARPRRAARPPARHRRPGRAEGRRAQRPLRPGLRRQARQGRPLRLRGADAPGLPDLSLRPAPALRRRAQPLDGADRDQGVGQEPLHRGRAARARAPHRPELRRIADAARRRDPVARRQRPQAAAVWRGRRAARDQLRADEPRRQRAARLAADARARRALQPRLLRCRGRGSGVA